MRCDTLFEPKQFFEFGFGENADTEFFSFVVLRAGIAPNNYVVSFFADGAGDFSTVLLHEFAGLFARTIDESTGEHERFASEFLALDLALFRYGMHASLV